MRVAVLGPLEVRTDDLVPVPVAGAKERLLLAVLIAGAPAAVGADRLVETLWDGAAPPTARKSLQAHVVRLRSALEPDRPHGSTGQYVVRRGPGYALALDRAGIDALRIGDLASRGRALLGTRDLPEAERQLAAAVGLWRGEPYADWPDAAFAAPERRRLEEVRSAALAGLFEVWLGQGRHADVVPEVERLVEHDGLREDWWRLLVLALYRSGRQADALAAARRARALLAHELGASPGPALRDVEAAVLAHDPALDLPPGRAPPAVPNRPDLTPATCPYKGLAAYQVADAPLFHGRRRLVAGLVARLVDAPLVVVAGPSGAGKSSVVRAGLVPALAAGGVPGSAAWQARIVVPGRRPVDALAELTGTSPPARPVLLVCDQAEQLWAPGVGPAERSAFLDTLLGLLDDGIVVRCVVVVRGDHVGRLAEHAPFTARLGAAVVLVPSLAEPDLREIVREPARTVGLSVEPELTDAVVADVLGRSGALPLLSTALVGTWERRRADALTLAGYLETGGVAGALTRSAESAYADLGVRRQDLARRLLVRLADVDETGTLVRRPVPLTELDLDGERGADRRVVIDTYVGRRLLAVVDQHVEVAHEALLTGWPRLARWLDDDAAGRAVRRHLAPAAREWAAGGEPDDELYRGARLAAALDWVARDDAETTAVEQRFLDASRHRADAELTEARRRAVQEAAGRRRTRRLAAGLAAVLVVALAAGLLAVRAQRAAQQASLVADANRLAALSRTADSLDDSLLLAAQAVRLAETPDTQDGLLTALVDRRRAVRAVPFGGRVLGAALGGDGRTLVLGVGGHSEVWSIGPASLPRKLMDLVDAWYFTDVSPVADLQLGGGLRSDGRPWLDLVAMDGSVTTLLEGDDLGGVPLAGAFAPDGRLAHVVVAAPAGAGPGDASSRWWVLDVDPARPSGDDVRLAGGPVGADVGDLRAHVADDAGSVVVRDAAGAAPPLLVDLGTGREVPLPAAGTADGPDLLDVLALPSGAARLWADGAVTLHDRRGAAVQDLEAHQAPVRDIAVAPDGTWAVTVGDDAVVVLWDVDPATGRWVQREFLAGHRGDVITADVNPAGDRLYTAALDDTVIAWDVSAHGGFGTPVPELVDRVVSNRPEVVERGRLVVTPTRPLGALAPDGPAVPDTVAATFLDARSGRVLADVEVGATIPGAGFGSSVAVSPDGGLVAVTWGLGATLLDTRTREEIARITLQPEGATVDGRALPARAVWCAEWTRGGQLLLGLGPTGSSSGAVAVVDPRSGAVERVEELPTPPQAMTLSPDERILAVASEEGPEVHLLDARAVTLERTVPLGADDLPSGLAFSPDGDRLAVVGAFGLLHVLDTGTWLPVLDPTQAHADQVLQVEWLPDGRTVVTSGIDGSVRLSDAERGLSRARPLPASTTPGSGPAYFLPAPESELVVLGGGRPGRRYPLDPAVWLAEACAIVGRDLTRAEWDRYLPGREYERTCTGRGVR